jgi:hypothetical protein
LKFIGVGSFLRGEGGVPIPALLLQEDELTSDLEKARQGVSFARVRQQLPSQIWGLQWGPRGDADSHSMTGHQISCDPCLYIFLKKHVSIHFLLPILRSMEFRIRKKSRI